MDNWSGFWFEKAKLYSEDIYIWSLYANYNGQHADKVKSDMKIGSNNRLNFSMLRAIFYNLKQPIKMTYIQLNKSSESK